MAITLVGQAQVTATDINVNTQITIPFDILPGDLVIASLNRSTTSGNILGGHVVSVSSGTIGTQWRTTASRASTHNLGMVAAFCTSQIASGSTLNVETTSNSNKRGLVVSVWRGCEIKAPEAATADSATGGNGSTSYGYNANANTFSFNVGPQTTPNALVIGTYGVGSNTNVFSVGSGYTLIADARTNSGSADRGVFVEYNMVSVVAAVAVTMTAVNVGGCCGVAMMFAAAEEIPVEGASVWVDSAGDSHNIKSMVWVDSNGNLHAVSETRWVDSSGAVHSGL